MKLVTFTRDNSREELGILLDGRVLPLEELGYVFADMTDLIRRAAPEELDAMRQAQGEGGALVGRIVGQLPHAVDSRKHIATVYILLYEEVGRG